MKGLPTVCLHSSLFILIARFIPVLKVQLSLCEHAHKEKLCLPMLRKVLQCVTPPVLHWDAVVLWMWTLLHGSCTGTLSLHLVMLFGETGSLFRR